MEGLYARTVLWLMTFTATAVGFIFMVNINISIVSMVRDHHLEEPGTFLSSECINNSSLTVPEENISNLNSTIPDDELRFDWDEKQQSLILGSYYWLNPVLMIPAGVMVQRFGPKLMIGLSNLIPCLLNFLMPFCARLDYRAVVFLRVLMGLVADLKWSALNNLAANWIPPDERSKFVIAYLGSSLGVGIAYPVCGFVISLWDWPAVFHVTGLIGILWFIIWWFLVYDSPSQHPRISTSEKEYILKCVSNTVTRKKVKVPWKSILLSRPLWINNLAMWGYIWALFTLMAQPPSYFKIIHGWDIRKTGLLTGAPHFLCMCIAILVSTTADYLLRNNIMTRTNVRKMATSICLIGQGVLVLGLAFSGCNALTAIVCLLVGTALGGAITAGAMANTIDLAPNHAGVLMALSNSINVLPGFLSPLIVGVLTYQNQTVGQWFWVYMITAIMLLVPGIVHLLYGTSELQEWNSSPDEKPNHELEKMFSRVSETEKEIESQYAVKTETKTKHDVKCECVKLSRQNNVNCVKNV